MRFLVRKLQEMYDYHFRKHFARCMADPDDDWQRRVQ